MKEHEYARANLFVGKYAVPPDGHIRLPENAKIQVLREITNEYGERAWAEHGDGAPWLMVDDGEGFWPVMVQLGNVDVEEKYQHRACAICWTISWEPVSTPNQCDLVHPHGGEHECCGYCALMRSYVELQERTQPVGTVR